MNLESLLPKLPLVTKWIDDTLSAHACEARPVAGLGFKRLPLFYAADFIARAKVVPVKHVPFPPLTVLGLPEFAPFERGDYSGITFKDTYFVQENEIGDESLHFHEMVHVAQWAHLGPEKFLLAYAAGLVENGYRNSPLEAMAYDLQSCFDQGGRPCDVESIVCQKLTAGIAERSAAGGSAPQ